MFCFDSFKCCLFYVGGYKNGLSNINGDIGNNFLRGNVNVIFDM